MTAVRAVIGILLLAVTAWVLLAVFSPPEPESAPMQFTSSQQCKECHAEVFAEWEQSWHSQAWVDPDVLSLSENFSNTDCIDCHAPRPVFFTGVGNRVLPRSSRRSEGVDCIACHALPGGGVAGTIDKPSAPCRPQATVELQRPEFCAGCHDQHKTVEQWRASRYPDLGLGCLECHMPFRDGDPGRGRALQCSRERHAPEQRSNGQLRGGPRLRRTRNCDR